MVLGVLKLFAMLTFMNIGQKFYLYQGVQHTGIPEKPRIFNIQEIRKLCTHFVPKPENFAKRDRESSDYVTDESRYRCERYNVIILSWALVGVKNENRHERCQNR